MSPLRSAMGMQHAGKASPFPTVTPPKLCPTPQGPGRFSALCIPHFLPAACLTCLSIPSQVIHIFSHIHQTYVVYSLHLDGDVTLDPALSPSRWVTEEEFHASAVSTAMKKVWGARGPSLSYLGKTPGIPSSSLGCPSSRTQLLFSSGLSCSSFRC